MESVIQEPRKDSLPGPEYITLQFATFADEIPAWGTLPFERDSKLRQFWPTENLLASAIYSTVAKYAGFGYTLEGPGRTTRLLHDRLAGVENGAGWAALVAKTVQDLLTQDNGAYLEVVREADAPNSPLVTLNHLDAGRCIPTGRRLEPVIYVDLNNERHLLKWYQVVRFTEFPSPIEIMRGFQYSGLTRVLRAAQIMRDIKIYKREKVSGRFNRAIHVLGGVTAKQVQDAINQQQADADSRALIRYIQPVVVASIDPTSRVSLETIELASLPDGFDEDKTLSWYITEMAMALGCDYQDLAPLASSSMGSGSQSQVLHMKARGKGSALFQRMIEHAFNDLGILPQTCRFRYGDQDIVEDLDRATLRLRRAQERAARISSGEISPEIARQIAVDVGDMDERYLQMFGEPNGTDPVVQS